MRRHAALRPDMKSVNDCLQAGCHCAPFAFTKLIETARDLVPDRQLNRVPCPHVSAVAYTVLSLELQIGSRLQLMHRGLRAMQTLRPCQINW